MADEAPELYQLVGAALRDVAQSRFMSDLFSRQISFVYERDGVLRRFPVPRVDIDEAEITLHFAIREVEIDPKRHSSRNAAIGSLFDQYSARIVRETIVAVRDQLRSAAGDSALDETKRVAIAEFEKRFLSDDNRELLTGRLLQYFNEKVEKIIRGDGTFDVQTVTNDLDDYVRQVVQPSDAVTLGPQFQDFVRADARAQYKEMIEELGKEIFKLHDRYPDYRITVDANGSRLVSPGTPVSSIKIKSTVRNYKWSKVDVDETDLRNIRTLSPE